MPVRETSGSSSRPSVFESAESIPVWGPLCTDLHKDFAEQPSLLKNYPVPAFIPDQAPNTPVLGRFEPDLCSQSARCRLFQQAEPFHALR
jgi:hypothetical protein